MTTAWEIDHDEQHDHGTVKEYVIGFVLCTLLTMLSFYVVMKGVFSGFAVYVALTVLAVVQLFVQLTFFLHLNTSPRMRWNVLSFVFTVIVVGILVVLSGFRPINRFFAFGGNVAGHCVGDSIWLCV